MNLKCFIIDDEPLAIEVIESHISKIDSLTVEGTFSNAVNAFQALRKTYVDVIFLDIQMPKLTGIEFLKSLKNPPKVVFTTAYREYALDGFELDVIDYLLKPISFERFLKAVDKLFDVTHTPSPQSPQETETPHEVFVISNNKNVKICLENIIYLESKRDSVFIKTEEKEVTTYQTISYMEERLPSDTFIRIHRSFMVNINKIDSWSNHEVEIHGEVIPIGRSYKREALKRLGNHSDVL